MSNIDTWKNDLIYCTYSWGTEYHNLEIKAIRWTTGLAGSLICDALGISPAELERTTLGGQTGLLDLLIAHDPKLLNIHNRFADAWRECEPRTAKRTLRSIQDHRVAPGLFASIRKLIARAPETYDVVLEEDEDCNLVASVLDLPGTVSYGATEDDALDNIKDAIRTVQESVGQARSRVDCNLIVC